ncbi:MAG TPA: ornithine carbamoyltransferase, partial [Candidatus Atribacteria bacterium]|nr:ornithine carbamoyltransferase [Candidatus Atribacteria bacterium]
MNKNFKGRDFTTVLDFSKEELWYALSYAKDLKLKRMAQEEVSILRGKILALIFEKPSLRTRVSFEVGMKELGGDTIYLSPQDIGLGKRESVKDTAEVIARYVSGIMVRTFSHKIVEDLAKYADVPVINGLSDTYHPCQAMGDMLTIWEKKGRIDGVNIAFIGDGNNVANSLMLLSTRLGANFSIASPKGYEIKEEILEIAKKEAERSDSRILITDDPMEAAKGADVIYTDVWASMGQESEKEERKR